MRKYEWISVIAIMFFISVVSVFTTLFVSNKYFITKIKTVSMVEVLNDTNDDSYQKFLEGIISQDEYSKLVESKMIKIQSALNYFSSENTLLLVEEALIKTDKKSISDVLVISMIEDSSKSIEIANELRKLGINTEIYFEKEEIL